jgi:hypothetical protein
MKLDEFAGHLFVRRPVQGLGETSVLRSRSMAILRGAEAH